MMPAGLGHQHGIAGLQLVYGSRTPGKSRQIALEPGHEDGKRGQWNIWRSVGHSLKHNLRVADHECGFFVQPGQRRGQFPLFHHHAGGVAVENIAYGLHLRQYEPPLGRAKVDGNHQHCQLARWQQVAQQARLCKPVFRRKGRQSFTHLPHALACHGGYAHPADTVLIQPAKLPGRRGRQIALAKNHTKRNFALTQLAYKKIFILAPLPRLYGQQGNIRALKGLKRALLAQLAQRAHIVNARSINKYHRPEGRQFQRFFHRIGGCAGRVGNNGNLLPRQCVEQGRLANIAPTIDAYVQAQTFGCFIHARSSGCVNYPPVPLPVSKRGCGLCTEQVVHFLRLHQASLQHHGAHALPCFVRLGGYFARKRIAKHRHKCCNRGK